MAGWRFRLRDRLSVAAIVPVYNEAETLPKLLRSLEALDLDEVVVVDGGSTDATHSILSQAAVNWIRAAQGRAHQMNAGAAICHSDLLIFIHADTQLSTECLLAMRRVFKREGVVGGRFDLLLSGKGAIFRLIEGMINLRSRITRISTGDQCIFVRRQLFEAMGGYAGIPLMEDVEFSQRLKRQGEIACIRERVVTSSRRWERRGVITTVLLMWRLRLLFWLGVSPATLAASYRNSR